MKKVEGIPFVVLKGIECDKEKKSFCYLKTPVKGLYYIPSEVERKSKTLLVGRFVPALLNAMRHEKHMEMHYGVVTSAWNFGLTWRPVKFMEVFNNKKTIIIDFLNFANRYSKLRSYYSQTLSKFYSSLALKKIIFRKTRLLPKKCVVYDDRYMSGFYIRKKHIGRVIKRYAPKNARRLAFLKKEYSSIAQDMKKLGSTT